MQMRINIPPLTRVLLALVLAISIAHQITRYLYGGLDPELLALIPQWSLFYPWVYFTATFAEQNVVTLLIAGATILYGGKYLERAWGSTEFGKFVLLVTVLPNFLATLVYVLWFAITRDESRAYVPPFTPLAPANKLISSRLVSVWPSFKGPLPFKAPSSSPSSSLFPSILLRSSEALSRYESNTSPPSSSSQIQSLDWSLAQTQPLYWAGWAFLQAGHTFVSTRSRSSSPALALEDPQ